MAAADFAFVVGLQLLVLIPIVNAGQRDEDLLVTPRHRDALEGDGDVAGLLPAARGFDGGDTPAKLCAARDDQIVADIKRLVEHRSDRVADLVEF